MQRDFVFHHARNILGEGLFVDVQDNQVFWTDINGSSVYRKSLDADRFDSYHVEGFPSAIFSVDGTELLLCSRDGVVSLDLESGEQIVRSENPDTVPGTGFRANDGVALDGDLVIYGTMGFAPEERAGGIYLYDGETTRSLNAPMGIPNGFVRLDESTILIADSLARTVNMYKFDKTDLKLQFVSCWHDFSSNCFTPDGGCTDYNGRVYFALWDGSGVAVLNFSGDLLEIIGLPVSRPTNCKLAGDNRLLVTSAREGLSGEQLRRAPLSGSVLEVQLGSGAG